VGRPRKSLLDQKRIAATALEIVDETGDFTMPELARRLGVQTASLYHHVDGRSGVVELLRARIGEEMPEDYSPDGQHWETALRELGRLYRASFAAHPHLVPLLTGQPVRAPKVLVVYERIVTLMESAGFPLSMIMTAFTAFENFLIGSALDLAAPEVMWEIPDDIQTPRLAAALAAQPGGRSRADQAFEFGLDLLIDGYRRVLDSTARSEG